MAVISLMNRKGGVGKSSSIAHVASVLARRKPRTERRPVLIVDTDSQGHAGKHLGVEPHATPNLANVLFDGMPAQDAVVDTHCDGVQILRGSRHLRDFDFNVGVQIGEELVGGTPEGERLDPYGILAEALAPLRERYAHILVDSGPGSGLLHLNVYRCADWVLVPSEADAGAIEGIMDLLNEIEEARQQIGSRVELLGIFFTRVAGFTSEHRDNMREIRDALGDLVLEPYVRTTTRMREAWRERLLITDHDRRSGVAQDYDQITREILRRIRSPRAQGSN